MAKSDRDLDTQTMAGLQGLTPYTARVSWWNHYVAMVGLSTMMLVRRKRLLLAALITLLPVMFPLLEVFLVDFAEMGGMFSELNRDIYLTNLSVILALFFGSMLLGEDLESQTMIYYLSRPLPRSIWVLGKFTAYLLVAGGLIILSQWLSYLANTLAPGFDISGSTLKTLAHYNAAAFLAVMGNGAVAMFLGVVSKRPIVLGVVVLIGWQRLASMIPGAIDFFTINKYVEMIAPMGLAEPREITLQTALGEIVKQQFYISAGKALPILLGITAAFVIATIALVRMRQFALTKAVGS